jgi:asparagine synthase (glutamine-hydrolysing)
MQLCHFMLALSVALSGANATPATPARHVKRPTIALRPIAGGHLWTHAEGETEPHVAFTLSRGVRSWHGEPVDGAEVSHRLTDGRDLAGLAAPYAVAMVDQGGRLSVATDHAGLRHIYTVQADGWAAVSSSARDLAELAGADLDQDSIGVFRMVGHHLGTATPYRGVTKLAPGHIARLANGQLTIEPYPQQPAPPEPSQPEGVVVPHADRLRATVTGFLDCYPGTVLELSGGLDSRMVLAAIPPSRRREVRALTLAYPGSTDLPVAAALARRHGMAHQVIDLTTMRRIEPHHAYQAALDAALRLDAQGSPLGIAALDWAEAQVDAGPRLSGHGGELARGTYYMQRPYPHVRPDLIDRLARWWILANAVPDNVFTPEFAAESRHQTHRKLHDIFTGYRTDWLTATDEFYLRERLHRWAGPTVTDAALARVVANPLLDPDIVALARTVPPERRTGSRYAARVLDQLDPDLAQIPLSSGLRPLTLGRRFTLARQLGENTVQGFTAKAARKVWRRVTTARPDTGLNLLANAVSTHLRTNPDLLTPAAETGLLNLQWLDAYLHGRTDACPATLDLLINLTAARNS